MKALNVRIFPESSQKYILARTSKNNQILLWGNPSAEWHKDIKTEMEEAGFSIEEVRGGGRIWLLADVKTIYVWGRSNVYGEVLFPEAKRILEPVYPDYNILNEVPPVE